MDSNGEKDNENPKDELDALISSENESIDKESDLVAGVGGIPLSNEIPNKRAVNNIVDSSLKKSKPKFGRLSKYFKRFLLIAFLLSTVPMLVLGPLFAGLIFLTGGVFGGFFVPGAIIIILLVVILLPKIIVFLIKSDNRKINQLSGFPKRLVKILLIFIVLNFLLGFILSL